MITYHDVERFGGVILRLFQAQYPDGATIEQLRLDAPKHRWIRVNLPEMESINAEMEAINE